MLPTACSEARSTRSTRPRTTPRSRPARPVRRAPITHRRDSPPAQSSPRRDDAPPDMSGAEHRTTSSATSTEDHTLVTRRSATSRPGTEIARAFNAVAARPSAYRRRSSTTTTIMRIRTRRPPPMYMTEPLPRLSRYEPCAGVDRPEHVSGRLRQVGSTRDRGSAAGSSETDHRRVHTGGRRAGDGNVALVEDCRAPGR